VSFFVHFSGVAIGENTFFFGCRHEKKDYLYRELWEEMQAKSHLHHFHTAFSRDQVVAAISAPLRLQVTHGQTIGKQNLCAT